MDAELARASSMTTAGYQSPYYVSLTAIDLSYRDLRCAMGAQRASVEYRQRLVTPDLRVGGRDLDNHPVAPSGGFVARHVNFEDDEFALRHALWRQLDAAFKNASADFLRKQALRVRRGKTEYDTDDLSLETPRVRQAEPGESPWPAEGLRSLCLEASREFRAEPGLLQADVGVKNQRVWSRLRDTEGSRVGFGRETAEVELEAVALSSDGMRLSASRRFLATTRRGLPGRDAVRAAAREMMDDLAALKVALTTSPFSAPALLDPSVSAAVMLAIGSRLTGEEQRNPNGAQIFRDKLGKPVLPEDLTLEDDPTVAVREGEALAGYYEFDDQGVPAQRVVLVEGGLLKGLLLSRYPVIGFPRSNGHGRAAPGLAPSGSPGSLFLKTSRPLPQERLLELLREECRRRGKSRGLWVRKLRSWSQQQGTGGQGSIRISGLIYLVEADSGALTLVRDLDFVGTPLTLMGNVLRAGDDPQAHHFMAGVPVSVVVPSLLLGDAELQRAETKPENPPVLPPPPAERARGPRVVPPLPRSPQIQVQRYTLLSRAEPFPSYVMEGLLALRQRREGADVVVEAKLVGRGLPELGATVKLMDAAVERLAGGARLRVETPAGVSSQSDYKRRFGDGWPE